MGKSLRSKVKKTYRGLKRQVLEPAAASRTLHLASALYNTAGLPLPDPAETGTGSGSGGNRASWTHGGFVPVTTFVPTPPAVRLNRVHGPLAAAQAATAAERHAPAPLSDYVGEREEPVVMAKDLPLQWPTAVFGGPSVSLPMPGVTSAVAAVAAEAAGAKAATTAVVAAPDRAAVGGGEVEMADAAAAGGRRREPQRRGRGGVAKEGKAPGAGQKRHPRNKVNRVHRLR